jgi:hypothetical protein
MISGAGLNSKALNATVAAGVILATVSWSASIAAVAVPTRIHSSIEMVLDGTVNSIFSPYQHKFAYMGMSGSAVCVMRPNAIFAGKSAWNGDGVLTSYLLNTNYAEVNFDGITSLVLLADSAIGSATWLSEAAVTIESVKTHSGSAAIISESSTAIPGGVVTRNVASNLITDSLLFAEGTLTDVNGDVFHGASSQWDASCALSVNNELVITGTYVFIGSGESNLLSQATLTQALHFHTAQAVSIELVTTKDSPLATNITTSSEFTGTVHRIGQATADWAGTSYMVGSMLQQHSVSSDISMTMTSSIEPLCARHATTEMHTSLDVTYIAHRRLTSDVPQTAECLATMSADVEVFVTAAWGGVAGWLSPAAIVTLTPAPVERIYTIPVQQRLFVIPETERSFVIGGISREFTI